MTAVWPGSTSEVQSRMLREITARLLVETDPQELQRLIEQLTSIVEAQLRTGKPVVIIQLYQDTIPNLNRVSIGFDLLGGTKEEQAKKVADLSNEHVLDVYVTEKEKGET